jgi:hypothetical protein
LLCRAGGQRRRNGGSEKLVRAGHADAIAPARQRARINWQAMLQKSKPQKNCQYGFSTQRSHTASSIRL